MSIELLKGALVLIAVFVLLSVLFSVLFKAGVILLRALGVLYLVKRILA